MSDPRDIPPTTYRDAGVDIAGGRARGRAHPRGGALDVPSRGHRRHRRVRRAVLGGRVQGHGRPGARVAAPTAWAPSSSSRSCSTGTTRWASTSWRCAPTTSSSPAPSRCSSSTTSRSASSTPSAWSAIVAGIAEGCRQAGCSLVGGEMAEHPGVDARRRLRPVRLLRRRRRPAEDDRRQRRGAGRRHPRPRRRAGCTPTASRSCASVLVEGHEAELDAAARRPRRADARRGAAHADAHLRASRCSSCSRRGVAGQGDGAHHRRRHHREPRPRAARGRATPGRARVVARAAGHRDGGRGRGALGRRGVPHVQHGHRLRNRGLARRTRRVSPRSCARRGSAWSR